MYVVFLQTRLKKNLLYEEVNEVVDERSMSVSRDTEAEIDPQGHNEFQQQGKRTKHKHQNLKEETLYKEISNSR